MFAVVKTGGKQYKVAANDRIAVEKLAGKPGDKITLDVLAIGNEKESEAGAPLVSGAKVTAEILEQDRHDKVVIFKKKRRQTYRRTKGHKQHFTSLLITEISGKQGKATADAKAKPAAKKASPAKTEAKKADAKKNAAKPTAKKSDEKAKPAAKKAAPKKDEANKPAATKAPAKKKPAAKKKDD